MPRPSHPCFRRPVHAATRAFSLIEVTIAIGITAFCLIPIIGMLPVGLRSLKESNEQAAAAVAVNQIATAIRKAASANGTDFIAYFGGDATSGKEIAYQITGTTSPTTLNLGALTIQGTPATTPLQERFSTHVTINPPTGGGSLGTAVISVAWPAAANPTWIDSSNKWDSKAEGSLTTTLRFLPRS